MTRSFFAFAPCCGPLRRGSSRPRRRRNDAAACAILSPLPPLLSVLPSNELCYPWPINMTCPGCGIENVPSAEYCDCGHEFVPGSKPTDWTPKGLLPLRDMRLHTLIRPTFPLLILPASHLVLCVVVLVNANTTSGSWYWFPVFLIDLPVSLLLSRIDVLPPIVIFGVFGTLWWYFVAILIRVLFTWRAD